MADQNHSLIVQLRAWAANEQDNHLPMFMIWLLPHRLDLTNVLLEFYPISNWMEYSDQRENKLVDLYNQVEEVLDSVKHEEIIDYYWHSILTHYLAVPQGTEERINIMYYVAKKLPNTQLLDWVEQIDEGQTPELPMMVLTTLPKQASRGLQYRWWQCWQTISGYSYFLKQVVCEEEDDEDLEKLDQEEREIVENKFNMKLEEFRAALEDVDWSVLIEGIHEPINGDDDTDDDSDRSESDGDETEEESGNETEEQQQEEQQPEVECSEGFCRLIID